MKLLAEILLSKYNSFVGRMVNRKGLLDQNSDVVEVTGFLLQNQLWSKRKMYIDQRNSGK